MMDKMDNCDWLRTELQDGGLRQIIHQVCEASNTVAHGQKTHQEVALEQAKSRYPTFERFMDKLLVLTGVLERQEIDEDLDDWLQRDDADGLGPLALVPIPRKQRAVNTKGKVAKVPSCSEDDDSDVSESEVSSGDSSEDSSTRSSDSDDDDENN